MQYLGMLANKASTTNILTTKRLSVYPWYEAKNEMMLIWQSNVGNQDHSRREKGRGWSVGQRQEGWGSAALVPFKTQVRHCHFEDRKFCVGTQNHWSSPLSNELPLKRILGDYEAHVKTLLKCHKCRNLVGVSCSIAMPEYQNAETG